MRRVLLTLAILVFTLISASAQALDVERPDVVCKSKSSSARRPKVKPKRASAKRPKAKRLAAKSRKSRSVPKKIVAAAAPSELLEAEQPSMLEPRAIKVGEELKRPLLSTQVEGDDWKIAMTDAALADLIVRIEREGFEDDKIAVVAASAETKYFSLQQAGRVLDAFTFSKGKTTALALLLPRIVDPEGRHHLLDHFGFGDDKDEAERIMTAVDQRNQIGSRT